MKVALLSILIIFIILLFFLPKTSMASTLKDAPAPEPPKKNVTLEDIPHRDNPILEGKECAQYDTPIDDPCPTEYPNAMAFSKEGDLKTCCK